MPGSTSMAVPDGATAAATATLTPMVPFEPFTYTPLSKVFAEATVATSTPMLCWKVCPQVAVRPVLSNALPEMVVLGPRARKLTP